MQYDLSKPKLSKSWRTLFKEELSRYREMHGYNVIISPVLYCIYWHEPCFLNCALHSAHAVWVFLLFELYVPVSLLIPLNHCFTSKWPLPFPPQMPAQSHFLHYLFLNYVELLEKSTVYLHFKLVTVTSVPTIAYDMCALVYLIQLYNERVRFKNLYFSNMALLLTLYSVAI